MMTWTEERVETLKQQWSAGSTAAEISAALGFSRSAILGKVHRLGLSERRGLGGPRRSTTRIGNVTRRAPSARAFTLKHHAPSAVPNAPEPVLIEDTAIQFSQRRTIMELNSATCRWPVGDPGTPGFFFCGGLVEVGRSYCPGHLARAIDRVPRPFAAFGLPF